MVIKNCNKLESGGIFMNVLERARLFAWRLFLKNVEVKLAFFVTALLTLVLSSVGPQLYNLEAIPFTYSVCCYD